jgi:hypothetical protein
MMIFPLLDALMSGWHKEFSQGPISPLVYKIMFEKE